MSWQYITALVVNSIGLLVALYFLISDRLKYDNVRFNRSLARATVFFALWMAAGIFVYKLKITALASMMAWVTAGPLLGYGVILLLFIVLKPDMK